MPPALPVPQGRARKPDLPEKANGGRWEALLERWMTGLGSDPAGCCRPAQFRLGFSIRTDLGAAGQPGSEGEFGWGGAYHSTYWVDPEEGLTVTYMTQLLPAGDIDDHGKLRTLIYQAID